MRIVDRDAIDHDEQVIRLGAAEPHLGDAADTADWLTENPAPPQQIRWNTIAAHRRGLVDDLDWRRRDVDRCRGAGSST
jgi:hypothetical protein